MDNNRYYPHTVNVPNTGKSPRAISFSEEWRQNIDLAHSYLEKAARRMKKHADKNMRSQEFNVGDKVMVKQLPQDRKFLRGRDSHLLQKYDGPLTIVKKIGKMAYKVDPPHWWSHQLHPVFHVSMLKPFYEDTADPSRGQIKRPGLKPKAAGKLVVEAILNDRVITASRKRHQEYLVKWQGYMDEEKTWERAADLLAYTDKIEAYHMQKLTRASIALVGEYVMGCPFHPPSIAPLHPSCTVPPHPSNTRPCALARKFLGAAGNILGGDQSLCRKVFLRAIFKHEIIGELELRDIEAGNLRSVLRVIILRMPPFPIRIQAMPPQALKHAGSFTIKSRSGDNP
ncbi:hypothetical protein RJ640_013038 [Escallonia rubra]|uniref:Chromo domain-containing protein n=1 Tax=Escallonia rubra TaxID=112253 RepID=A0AA88RL56_9ASTE|nr:hypothetical protein RJ640_013038 [Escallonia rubra]